MTVSGLNEFEPLTRAASSLGNLRARTWLILAAVGFGILGSLAWAGIAILSWLWAQAPAVTETGKRLAGGALTQVEQVAPGLKEQAGQWLPGVTEQVDRWLPGLAADLPASDVSGTDVGPVPRYLGLVRSHFTRDGQAVEVRYAGRAAFDAVLAHYVQGFTAAGYLQEVMAATPEGEQHRFRHGEQAIDLSLLRRPGGQVQLRLNLLPQ